MHNPLFQTPRLPYDVLVEIIEFFLADSELDDGDQTHNLKIFAFLSRPIRVFCQKRLFHKYKAGKVDGQLCRSILDGSPHLIAYVKEVWLYAGRGRRSPLSSEQISTVYRLTSAHHLFVGPTPVDNRLTSAPRITSFAATGFGKSVPFLPLSKWRYLNALEVREDNPDPNSQNVDPGQDSDADSEDDRLREDTYEDFDRLFLFERALQASQDSMAIKLQKLCIVDSDKILLLMLLHPDHILEHERNEPLLSDDPQDDETNDTQHHFDFTELRSLTADITPANLLPIWHIIHQARDHLRHLDIRERCRHKSPRDPFGFNSTLLPDISPIILPDAISLAPLTHLHALSITIILRDDLVIHPDALSSWCALLRTAPRGIRTLELTLDAFYFIFVGHLTAWFPVRGYVAKDGARWAPLTQLDEIIASDVYFPSLERVSVRVAVPEDARVGHSDGSECDGMVVDVVCEEDVEEMHAWASEERRKHSEAQTAGDGVDVPIKEIEYPFPLPRSQDTRPTFSDDADSWTTREHPIDFDDVADSISFMLSRTRQRLASTNSFSVNVNMGLPSTT